MHTLRVQSRHELITRVQWVLQEKERVNAIYKHVGALLMHKGGVGILSIGSKVRVMVARAQPLHLYIYT